MQNTPYAYCTWYKVLLCKSETLHLIKIVDEMARANAGAKKNYSLPNLRLQASIGITRPTLVLNSLEAESKKVTDYTNGYF